MNHRFVKPALLGGLATLFAFTACGVAASRAPLGGNYAIAESPATRNRTATSASAVAEATEPKPAPLASNTVVASALLADAGAPLVADANRLHYDPLKIGDKVKAEVKVSFDLELQSGHPGVIPGDGKVGVDARYRLDLKVTQASAQTLDELEVTVTPLSMRTRYGEHAREAPLDAAETFQVTLGRSPSVKASTGSASQEQGRAALLLLCSSLAAFHERWARSPNLELNSGWSSKSPVSVPRFLNRQGEVLQVGPFVATYTHRDTSADRVPFELALPASYGGALGKLDFDFKGTAQLSAAQARPLSIELSGPANGSAGPQGELSARGFSKFEASLSYP
ncbi:MAG: hypothetical protein ABI488_17005 [Polyangiaceae bacterium]